MAFVNAWSRNGFYLLVGPPTTNVTPYGPAGYIQQFPALAPAKGTLALFKPDTTTNFNVLQMQAAMFAYYSSVGVGTAGYPTQDTLTCPTLASQPTNSCQWQPFASNYVLFAYSNLLANAAQNFAVRDPYYTKWNTFGGIYGLGPATSAETAVTGSAGSKATEQTYDAGAIYNITSGTLSGRLLAVKNPIYATYLSTGAHAGPLGLPATEELAQADGTFVQNFEGGAVQRDPKTGNVTVLPSVATIALTPAGPVQMNLGDTLAVTASLYSSAGSPLTGRSVGWNTSNGRVVSIQSNGLQATLTAVGGGTASVTVTSGGKTSPPLSVSVSAPCCQIGEGAPTPAIQQSFQSAVTRNGLSVQLPAAMAATRVGNGYVQQLLGTGASPASYLVTVADGSAAGYVVTGAILARFLALGGPAGMLGYPQSDATAGGRQTFQAGALAGNPVQLVSGAILTKWGTLGYETGVGSPTAPAGNFQTFRGTAGTQQAFDNALILAPTIGPLAGRVFAVTGLILAQYSAAGGPGGDLGSPTGDEIPVNGLRQQSFEGGSASYAPGATSATVTITPRQPLVTAAPASVLSGSTVHLVAGGFDNGAMVRVSQTGQPDFTVTVANGAYTWDVHVPTSAANGVVVVRAIDVNRNLTAQAAYSIANAASALLRMSVVGGDQQTGPPGAQLGQPLVVSVTDQNGNPAPGQAVTFAASPGASVTPTTSVTDSNGQASAALRLPASEGVAIASASAVHLVVSFSARAAALSLSNFPALTQTVDGTLDNGSDTIRKKGAMVTAAASVLRHYQLRNLLPQPNGLADPASLNQFLKSFCVTDGNGNKTCDGFVTLGQSTEQTVNLWRVGAFAGNQVDVRIEDAGLGHVRDLLAGGYPVLLSLSLSGLGAHFVTAMGVAPDGSILIADPDPGYGQTNLNGYLNGFTAAGIGVKGSLTGAVRLVPQPPAAAGFLVYANAPISISSAGGNCGPALDFPDTASVAGAVQSRPPGEIYFHP